MPILGNQIHIAPLGVEKDRIIDPLIGEGADRVVLLEYIPPFEYPDDLMTEIEDELASEGIGFERKRANLENLFKSINAFGEVISECDSKDDVLVNISSGNKIGAAGGLMACMESQSAIPYYVKAEVGTSMVPDGKNVARDVKGWDAIPLYPLERPSDDQLRIMKHISEADTDLHHRREPFRIKSDLVTFAKENGLSFIQNCEGGSKAEFSLLRHHIINPLKEKGFIKIESVGVKDEVMLTEDGRNTFLGFSYLIEDEF